MNEAKTRLEQIRKSIQAENVSYGELAELQSLVDYINAGDIELLEWAGVPENEEALIVWAIKQAADRLYFHGEDITPADAQRMAGELWQLADKLTDCLDLG